jgi:putative membrane protein
MVAVCHFAFITIAPVMSEEEGLLPTPVSLWSKDNWSWELSLVVPLLLLLVWYAAGAIRRGSHARLVKHHLAFAAGWSSLFLALVSPLHRLGDVLFSAHMLQHEIMLLISAPLIAAAHPSVTLLYAMPRNSRQPVGVWITRIENISPYSIIFSPLGAFILHAAALWLWHIPYLYQAGIEFDFIHALQHLSFFLSGALFWSALFGAGRSTMTYGAGVLYVFGTAAHCSALGALLTFSSVIWYPIYSDRTGLWHLTPLQDQQIGGLLMWVPSGVVFILIGIWLFARWLTASDQRLTYGVLSQSVVEAEEHR